MEIAREIDEEEELESKSEELGDELIINTIEKDLDDTLNLVEEYRRSQRSSDDDCTRNPAITYLNEEIFTILLNIMEITLFKAIEENSLQYHKTPFNPMDYIAEHLWNLNPKHPERQQAWVNIFDMDWAKELLKLKPRPYFPFSWIWSKEYAALKIQSYVRGYWVRRREDVQEVRQFWKALVSDEETEEERKTLRPKECPCLHFP